MENKLREKNIECETFGHVLDENKRCGRCGVYLSTPLEDCIRRVTDEYGLEDEIVNRLEEELETLINKHYVRKELYKELQVSWANSVLAMTTEMLEKYGIQYFKEYEPETYSILKNKLLPVLKTKPTQTRRWGR